MGNRYTLSGVADGKSSMPVWTLLLTVLLVACTANSKSPEAHFRRAI
jgi:hypothetical protein